MADDKLMSSLKITIDHLIDRDYDSVSILERVSQVTEWLNQKDYFVVIDKDLRAMGVITLQDVHKHLYQVINCNFNKPHVNPSQSVFEVFETMRAAKTNYLPVYQHKKFIGVISQTAITKELITVMLSTACKCVVFG
jgi:predicted transcriptional regulator